ncbi:hypothetical protein CMU59_18170 [Elizabethkingia anophelis]|uniref:hypothetical protein n=1 Tax=Elizabethkingia anophelis TaxID=1117645 RepID=UPI0021A502C7|nr:hypothetical protein [Elizabethkingia anophelis]MCT3947673.1 hypothetical protein [Elizabethkingia anophelis]MDV3573444.1 hypothetical protein [Elizabethkingia anophelis]MDV3601302.1 hypothetical protein [Elizabethkingia anophelis]MDV3608633.1 hypothetical protein [Elizabethkingia anophelis]
MNSLFKQIRQKCLDWILHHPKKFFTYSMIFLSVSFVGSLIQGIFFPLGGTVFKIKPPSLYSKSQMPQNPNVNNEKEMKKIVEELKILKVKRDGKQLQKQDSLRIEYLFNQYQQLKNDR